MFSFLQYIVEVFDRPLTWKWTHTLTSWSAEIEVSADIKYNVDFDSLSRNHWELNFSPTDDTLKKQGKSLTDYNAMFGVTGDGNAFKIFSTVFDILKNFIEQKHPEEIEFSAKESSRRKLMNRFIKTVKIPGYSNHIWNNGYYKIQKEER